MKNVPEINYLEELDPTHDVDQEPDDWFREMVDEVLAELDELDSDDDDPITRD